MAQYLDTTKVAAMYKAFRATLPRVTYKYMLAELKAMEESIRSDLAVATASTTVAGKVELATATEAKAGTSSSLAMTPATVQSVLGNLIPITFTGKNGAGACTATGLAVGDVVIRVSGITDVGTLVSADFESTITVNDQIQQVAAGDLSTKTYFALVYRPS